MNVSFLSVGLFAKPTRRFALLRSFVFAILCLFFVVGARAEVVTYVQQTSNLANTFTSGTAGAFNQSTNEIGMFANTSGAKQVVVWRDFKTSGNNTGSARSLQVGDLFTVTVSATSAFGGIGFSLNDNGTQGTAYTNRISGSRLYVQEVGTTASWEVNSNPGFTSLNYNVDTTRRDYGFEVYITSETTANVQMLVGGALVSNRAFNLSLNGTAGANIDAFSMWLSDDYNGTSNQNIFWKQETTVENRSEVELGYYLASGTFDPGKVTDGLAANSTSTNSVNAAKIGGDSGSAVLLNQENTYTGATTVNANATARASHANAFGTTAGGVSVTSGGAIELSGGITVGVEALTLNGTGVSSGGALRNTTNNNTWGGAVTLGSASSVVASSGTLTLSGNTALNGNRLTVAGGSGVTVAGQISGTGASDLLKQGSGALTLSGDNSGFNPSGSNSIYIDQGTVYLAHNSAGGATNKNIDLGSGVSGDGSAALYAIGGRTIANPITIESNNTTALTIGSDSTTEDNTFTGNITLEKTASFNAGSGRSVTFSTGALSGSGGLTKTGLGTVTLSGNNAYAGATTVSAGVLNLNASSGSAAGSTASISVANNATLLISQSNQVNDVAAVSLSGGTIQRGSGVTETFGALTLAAASTLNFGTGDTSSLNFGAYTGAGFKLNVSNFLQGNTLTFRTDLSGSINNTALFGFDNGFTSSWSSGTTTFTITAIPEPSTYFAAAGLLALFLWPMRRRLLKDAKFLLGLRPTGRA